jgi:hypothetical protein
MVVISFETGRGKLYAKGQLAAWSAGEKYKSNYKSFKAFLQVKNIV